MLLRYEDRNDFAPGLADLPQATFELLSAQAQDVAESSLGANRSLEVVEFRELISIRQSSGNFQLAYWPVISITLIRVRTGQQRTRTLRGTPAGEWRDLESDDYFLDIDGRVQFQASSFSFGRWGYSGYGAYGGSYRVSSRTTQFSTAEATYTSGFDPVDTTPEVNQLKRALGSLASVLFSTGSQAKGLRRKESKEDYVLEYFAPNATSQQATQSGLSNNFTVPELFMLPFRKYAPRGGIV